MDDACFEGVWYAHPIVVYMYLRQYPIGSPQF